MKLKIKHEHTGTIRVEHHHIEHQHDCHHCEELAARLVALRLSIAQLELSANKLKTAMQAVKQEKGKTNG